MAGAVGGAALSQGSRVQLGYVDEQISEKYLSQVDFSTSKIGGLPVTTLCHVFKWIIFSLYFRLTEMI
jgi:hypothetical protein